MHPSAPLDLITAAYWRLAEDIQGRRSSQAEAGMVLHRLTVAYETLASPQSRAEYDALIGLGQPDPLPAATRPRRRRGLFSRGGNGDTPAPDHGLDYYEVLRVQRTASRDIVDLAYRTMRDYYIRVVSIGAAPPELLDLLAEAHAVTSDPDLRQRYDERYRKGRRAPVPGSDGPPDPAQSEAPKDASTPAVSGGIPHGDESLSGAGWREFQREAGRTLRADLALAARNGWKLLTLMGRISWRLALLVRKAAVAAANAVLDRLSDWLIDYRARREVDAESEEAVLQRLSLLTPEPRDGEARRRSIQDAVGSEDQHRNER